MRQVTRHGLLPWGRGEGGGKGPVGGSFGGSHGFQRDLRGTIFANRIKGGRVGHRQ